MATQTNFRIRKPVTSDDFLKKLDFIERLSRYGNKVVEVEYSDFIMVSMSVEDDIDMEAFNKLTDQGY